MSVLVNNIDLDNFMQSLYCKLANIDGDTTFYKALTNLNEIIDTYCSNYFDEGKSNFRISCKMEECKGFVSFDIRITHTIFYDFVIKVGFKLKSKGKKFKKGKKFPTVFVISDTLPQTMCEFEYFSSGNPIRFMEKHNSYIPIEEQFPNRLKNAVKDFEKELDAIFQKECRKASISIRDETVNPLLYKVYRVLNIMD